MDVDESIEVGSDARDTASTLQQPAVLLHPAQPDRDAAAAHHDAMHVTQSVVASLQMWFAESGPRPLAARLWALPPRDRGQSPLIVAWTPRGEDGRAGLLPVGSAANREWPDGDAGPQFFLHVRAGQDGPGGDVGTTCGAFVVDMRARTRRSVLLQVVDTAYMPLSCVAALERARALELDTARARHAATRDDAAYLCFLQNFMNSRAASLAALVENERAVLCHARHHLSSQIEARMRQLEALWLQRGGERKRGSASRQTPGRFRHLMQQVLSREFPVAVACVASGEGFSADLGSLAASAEHAVPPLARKKAKTPKPRRAEDAAPSAAKQPSLAEPA